MKSKLRWMPLLIVALLLLTACSEVGGIGKTELMRLYDRVFTGVFWWVVGGGMAAGLLVGGLLAAKAESCSLGAVVMIVIMLLHALIGYTVSAPNRAEHAVTTAWEDAKDDQARYREKIHGYWAAYDEIIHECSRSSISRGATGCKYVREDCDTDDDGHQDCDYYPWFKYERTLTAVLYDNWKNPNIEFASHLAPRDWKNNQAGWVLGGVPWGEKAGVDFQYEDPESWALIKEAIDARKVLPGSRYNQYLNWQHANDRDLYLEYSGHIPKYREAGVLPTINPIHDVYRYDMVQFSSALNLTAEQEREWQEIAHLWGGEAGQQVQASLILYFAQESQVEDSYTWVKTSKAHLQDESVFGRDMLPKNMVLVNCLVNEEQTTITECRLETGMFEGNNRLKQGVSNLADLPFTPEAFFGSVSARFAEQNEKGWLIPEVSISGGSVGPLILDNFTRVEMETKEYLRTGIKPTPEQIEAIYRSAVLGVLKAMGTIYFVILMSLGFLAGQE